MIMRKSTKAKRTMRNENLFDEGWKPVEINNEEELTLLTAVCQIVDVVRNSGYDPTIFEFAERPIEFISKKLGLTETQSVVYAIVMDIYFDNHITTHDIGRCLDISPIKSLSFHEELEALCKMKYLVHQYDDEDVDDVYRVSQEAIDALKQNRLMEQKKNSIETPEDWFIEVDKIVTARCRDRIDYDMLCERINNLIADTQNIPLVKRFTLKTEAFTLDEKMLFLWLCNMVVSDGFRNFLADGFKNLYDKAASYRIQRRMLANGSSRLIKEGLVRVSCADSSKMRDCYELTPYVTEVLFEGLDFDQNAIEPKDIIKHTTITAKQLFYGEKEHKAIDRLTSLLQPERFTQVSEELKKQGFRSGFACLFHGAPGTGKTETALQLARATGRDIIQVNISEIKSKWVGESEKNVKDIFTRYRDLVRDSEIAPILLFNEADAIIGKRLEDVARSVDKMENAMQNILLEEIEKMEGILIATTNLTCNMDKAFERRFLYKIEFEKPSKEAKCSIWKSMIPSLSDIDALTLAEKYDFSGGQIENIARKNIVDTILSGEELSIESLRGHCDAEILDKRTSRNRLGF